MAIFYFIAFLPIIVGLLLLWKNRQVVIGEFFGSAALAFILAGTFHYAAIRSQTGDYETWSGQITRSVHYPRWVEREDTTVTDYDSKGNASGSHTETTYTTHDEHWAAETSTGEEHEIEENFFSQIAGKFGGITDEYAYKGGFDSGDHDIYVAYNKTGFVYPTNTWRSFQNRLRASPNLFQFAKVPAGVAVYPYPKNDDWLTSDRLVGGIKGAVDQFEFDRMNTRLGPSKKVNVILVGFKNRDAQAAQYQQSAWFGGRKNDLVLCYDATGAKPDWSVCFGWTEQEIVKRNLESIALEQGVSTATLPVIEAEVVANYQKKDWHKFDYISIPPPAWALIWFPIALVVTQAGYWLWAINNQFADHPSRRSFNFN